MPRQSKEINPFDGGLNDFSDPRDIEENELAFATNINTSNAGRITMGDDFNVGSDETFGTVANNAALRGKGLFRYNSDYNASNALGDTEYELMTDGNNVSRKTVGGAWVNNVVSMSTLPDNAYFVADGGVRISDKKWNNELKYLGISKRRVLGSGSDTIDLISGNASIDEPTGGSLLFDPATPKTATITSGSINLEIQQKTASQTTVVDFNDNSGPSGLDKFKSDDIQTKHGYPDDDDDDNFDNWGTAPGDGNQNSNTYGASGRFNTLTLASSQGSEVINADHDGVGTDKFLAIVKKDASGSDDYVRTTIRLNESTMQQDFEDKSFYFKIWTPTDVKVKMQTNGLRIRIGNTIKTNNVSDGSNDNWLYDIPTSELNADDWTEIECAYGAHDEVEGSPNSFSVDTFAFTFAFTSNNEDWTNENEITWALDDIKIGESTRGMWNGYYRWYYSWIYDTKQESKTFQFTNQTSPIIIENKIVQAKVQAIENGSGFLNGSSVYSKRITGANIYYAEFDLDDNPIDSDKKLFMISDFERGIRKPSDESHSSWDTTNSGGGENGAKTQSVYTNYFDTPIIDTFQTTAGYIEDDKISKIQFKTATVMNRKAYIANVKLTEDTGSIKYYTDRIYKSEPNMFDVFTDLSYIDVAVNDGDTNTALIGFGDYLLQFKTRTMYLINVTQDIEYLEGTYEFRGVWGESAVCKIPEGIAWVNNFGAFLFNGNEVIDLLGKKLSRTNWDAFIGDDPMIAYKPLTQDIVIVTKALTGKAYVYNMPTESWTFHVGITNDTAWLFSGYATNMITLNDGTVKMYTNYQDSLKPLIWKGVLQDKHITIVTKDQTLGDPAQRKTLKKVYITHKGANNTPTVEYISNNNESANDLRNVLLNSIGTLPTSATMVTTAFAPDNATEANNKYSYQVKISGVADKSFTVNDISLVYRDKTLK